MNSQLELWAFLSIYGIKMAHVEKNLTFCLTSGNMIRVTTTSSQAKLNTEVIIMETKSNVVNSIRIMRVTIKRIEAGNFFKTRW